MRGSNLTQIMAMWWCQSIGIAGKPFLDYQRSRELSWYVTSSFANTDLDFQLHQREIKKLVFVGLVANTCLESTARHAYEL